MSGHSNLKFFLLNNNNNNNNNKGYRRIKSTQWKEWCKTGRNTTHEGKSERGFKEEMEKQNNAWAVHKEYGIISSTNFNAQFFYPLTIYLLHYYPRYVSSINMPIFRRKNYIHTESGIFTLCKRLPITLVESGVRSQPVYWADVYRERRYQMLCEYNFSSWRWAC